MTGCCRGCVRQCRFLLVVFSLLIVGVWFAVASVRLVEHEDGGCGVACGAAASSVMELAGGLCAD